ncbi:MAG TPA: hypothetical protein VFE05_07110 [Longimicrobiaceae bacterium]|jgi:hypothetical protein|nr:hypothetical protein [Longimicrobiaceae bacterium]
MKKFALNLDELKVTAFETTPETLDTRGTVGGQMATTRCDPTQYVGGPTCMPGSCGDSCFVPRTGDACWPC